MVLLFPFQYLVVLMNFTESLLRDATHILVKSTQNVQCSTCCVEILFSTIRRQLISSETPPLVRIHSSVTTNGVLVLRQPDPSAETAHLQ